jgi:phage terminase large subunit-like protein
LTNTGIQTDRNGNIVPVKNQSPKQRIDGTASLLNASVGLYEHYAEYTAIHPGLLWAYVRQLSAWEFYSAKAVQ